MDLDVISIHFTPPVHAHSLLPNLLAYVGTTETKSLLSESLTASNIVLEKLEVDAAYVSFERQAIQAAQNEHVTKAKGVSAFTVKGFQPSDDEDVHHNFFAHGNPKTRIGGFGYRYACGSVARDTDGNLIGQENDQVEINYAEHKMMGGMLRLEWLKTDPTAGDRELTLPNGVKLSYAETNGFVGNSFGSYHPVYTWKDFDQPCEYFMDTFDTLGKSGKALEEVASLRQNRKEEVEAIAKAVNDGKSTSQVYKRVKRDGIIPGILQED
ncbi:hypothetical protein MMC15_005191 [Xylographa vitiligo]|nr:hypothetical protein [Xylographa vitiligo]